MRGHECVLRCVSYQDVAYSPILGGALQGPGLSWGSTDGAAACSQGGREKLASFLEMAYTSSPSLLSILPVLGSWVLVSSLSSRGLGPYQKRNESGDLF